MPGNRAIEKMAAAANGLKLKMLVRTAASGPRSDQYGRDWSSLAVREGVEAFHKVLHRWPTSEELRYSGMSEDDREFTTQYVAQRVHEGEELQKLFGAPEPHEFTGGYRESADPFAVPPSPPGPLRRPPRWLLWAFTALVRTWCWFDDLGRDELGRSTWKIWRPGRSRGPLLSFFPWPRKRD